MKIRAQIKVDELERKMAEKNFSSEDFAEKIGISNYHLSRLKKFEKYHVAPSPKLRNKMLDVLECAFDDIFFV